MTDKEIYTIPDDQWPQLAEETYRLGYQYEQTYHGCGQCTIAAILDTLKMKQDAVFRSATGLSGGLGLVGEATCSALTGAVMVFGLIYPRRRKKFDDDRENKYRVFSMAQEMCKHYLAAYGSLLCHGVHTKMFGRPYDLQDPEERERFEQAGAHEDGCPNVVASAAKWAVEIIGEEIRKDQESSSFIS